MNVQCTPMQWNLSSIRVIRFPIPEPSKVYHTRSPRCLGCPYPRHGLMCHSGDDGSCLRTDMQELDAKNVLIERG